jgi:hypothetical protein
LPFWAIFFGIGHIFFWKILPKWFGCNFFQKNRPKFTLISSWFGLIFDLKFPNFDKIFLWEKILLTEAPFWAIFGQNWAHFSVKRLVTLARTFCPRIFVPGHSVPRLFVSFVPLY